MRIAALNLQANCALGAVVLTSTWDSSRRWRRYSLYGCTLTVVGLAMLYITVSHLSVNVFLAQMVVVPVVMAAVSYFVHRFKTFGDRTVSENSGGRFLAVRLGGMGISKISFVLLVGVLGLQYLLASMLIIATLAWPTYRLNRDWAFKPNYTPTPDSIRGLYGATPPILR